MVPADLAGVVALEHELFRDDPWTAEMFAGEVAQPPESRLYLLAEASAGVAGAVVAGAVVAGAVVAGAVVAGAVDAGAGDAGAVDAGAGDKGTASGPGTAGGPVVAGYAGMMFLPGGTQADVLTIAVRPVHWGQGIGSALLGTLLDAARSRGCAEVFLEVRADNPRAHGLYLRRGFTDLGLRRGYYQPSGVDAIVMRKDLHQ
jgi:ribosomal-protein-alanine acetyltransferase